MLNRKPICLLRIPFRTTAGVNQDYTSAGAIDSQQGPRNERNSVKFVRLGSIRP